MENNQLIENVLVYNGKEEQILNYNHSHFRIKNLVNWVLGEIPSELVNEINENKLQVYIETDLEYSKAKFINLETDNRELLLRFRNLTIEYCN
ncbi:hypothetical protein [uncultured Polaribacter sp.]|uniref:hypothetical protein n=1 Tax=uncultured Polaribacter sp. TaxID=174711 RepID=UPI00261B2CDF|nr:hypothetical protein [uncultured Polaribacter sp.]